jgi:APA family basic amino acid/polyamine antiporter
MSVPASRVMSRSATVEAAPRPALSLIDTMALIVGTIVGVGIFRMPALVAGNADSTGVVLLAWLAGGAVSLVGALCYAELATTYPHPGGDYHYLTRALGPRVGFLFAWARLSVIQTGSIAILAFVLGDYAAQIVPLGPLGPALYAMLAIAALTATNVAGVRQGKSTQNVLTGLEVLGVVVLIVAGLSVGARLPEATAATGAASGSAFGLVMVFVLLTYGGWNEAAYLSAEVKNPQRTVVAAFVWSLLLVTVLYVLVNWAFISALGLSGVAQSKAVAADLMDRAVGPGGARLVSLLVVVAALTSANATIFTGARTAYALGRDFAPFALLGRWHPGTRTPVNALVVQAVVACALVVLGVVTRNGFETMVEYTAPVFWLFFLLTGVSLLVLRRRDPGSPRPFRVPLYPLTPLVFCATSAYLLYSSLVYTGVGALVGVGVLVVGALLLLVTGGAAPRARDAAEGGH